MRRLEWGKEAEQPPDETVTGGDADLAAAVARRPGGRFRFVPEAGSDVARALGLGASARPGMLEVPLDALRAEGSTAVNAIVVGRAPDRLGWWSRRRDVTVVVDGRTVWSGPATTVVVAVGEFLRGADVVPRGHPGDGVAEVQVYRLGPGKRAAMRRRMRAGAHVPHPDIGQWTGRSVEVHGARALPVEGDGRRWGRRHDVTVAVVPAAYHLVV